MYAKVPQYIQKTNEECVQILNNLIIKHNLMIPRISSYNHFTPCLFYQLFEIIFGLKLDSDKSEVEKLSLLLKAISDNILGINLDHIKPEALIKKDRQTIFNLLEIFQASAQLFLPPQIKKTCETKQTQTDITKSLSLSSSTSPFISSSSSSSSLLSLSSLSSSLSLHNSSDALESSSDSSCLSEDIKQKNKSSSTQNSKNNKKQTITKSLKALPKVYFKKKIETEKIQTESKLNSEITNLAKADFEREINNQLCEALQIQEENKTIEKNFNQKKNKHDFNSKLVTKPSKKLVKKPFGKSTQKSQLNSKKHIPNKSDFPISKIKPSGPIHLYSQISKETFKKLEKQKEHLEKLIKNLHHQVKVKQQNNINLMLDELKRQEKKLELLKKDLNHLQFVESVRTQKIEQIKKHAIKRDSRIEQAHLFKLVQDFQRKMLAKIAESQYLEERLIKENFENVVRQTRDDIIDLKNKICQDLEDDNRKRDRLLEAFRNLYEHTINSIKRKINDEENFLHHQLKCYLLKSLN